MLGELYDYVGGFDGEIYSATVHSSSGGREGYKFHTQHVCNGQSENGCVRVLCRRRELEQ
jgi:hypothetical protein